LGFLINGRTRRPDKYFIKACPQIAGQNQPKAMVTNIIESRGHEKRFEI
jgi:hypothetical protein